MNRLDKVIKQARGMVQLLERVAEEEERLQVAEWDRRLAEKESPQGWLNYALLQTQRDPNQLELGL